MNLCRETFNFSRCPDNQFCNAGGIYSFLNIVDVDDIGKSNYLFFEIFVDVPIDIHAVLSGVRTTPYDGLVD